MLFLFIVNKLTSYKLTMRFALLLAFLYLVYLSFYSAVPP